MISIVRCGTDHPHFKELITLLDAALLLRNGPLQTFYDKHNLVGSLETVVVAYADGAPAGSGCFKKFDASSAEVKRMFVRHEHRRVGISRKILAELEKWAVEDGFSRALIETGSAQFEAVKLYTSSGYSRIAGYGPYIGFTDSVCFEKKLSCAP